MAIKELSSLRVKETARKGAWLPVSSQTSAAAGKYVQAALCPHQQVHTGRSTPANTSAHTVISRCFTTSQWPSWRIIERRLRLDGMSAEGGALKTSCDYMVSIHCGLFFSFRLTWSVHQSVSAVRLQGLFGGTQGPRSWGDVDTGNLKVSWLQVGWWRLLWDRLMIYVCLCFLY